MLTSPKHTFCCRATISLLLCLFLAKFYAQAQDLIVNDRGDSINCKITKVDDTYIKFRYAETGERPQQAVMKLVQVKYYAYNFYGTTNTAPELTKDTTSLSIAGGGRTRKSRPVSDKVNLFDRTNYQFIGALKAGAGYMGSENGLTTGSFITGLLPPNFDEHYKNLRRGTNLGLDMTYMHRPSSSLSVAVARWWRTGSIGGFSYYDSVRLQTITGSLVDKISVTSVGLFYGAYFSIFPNGGALYSKLGGNVIAYQNNMTLVDEKITISAADFNLQFMLGLDYPITEKSAIAIELSNFNAVIRRFDFAYNGQTQNIAFGQGQAQSLTRWELSLVYYYGLRKRK